jgi:hypothetical protein
VDESVVTGPASPSIASIEDLSGKEVFVRKSSSYYEHLVGLNRKRSPSRSERSIASSLETASARSSETWSSAAI